MKPSQKIKIETAILKVFSECNVDSFPISCKKLLHYYGYSCIPYDSLSPQKKEACFAISDDAFCLKHKIFYNNKALALRIRFSLMHELGHICLNHTKVSNETIDPESEANLFASLILAPRMAIHYSRCRTAEDISQAFKLTLEASNYALMDYYHWYDHTLKFKMSALDKAMYKHFYDPTEKKFIWRRQACLSCGTILINHLSGKCPVCENKKTEEKYWNIRMEAGLYSYHDREPWLPEGFERAEYQYLYGDLY